MRLLNVETRKLREFVISVPEYAILSHTWGDDEVTFQDLDCPDHTKKRGYTKIDGFCCLAAKNGFEWVWVDTCCIDKTSSAELSEAINSMYRWYKDSQICYAYLEDIQPDDDLNGFDRQFGNSRWFTRGWTLQELLAPPAVSFFNAAWKELGTRSSLAREIGSITSIPTDFLRDRHVHRAKVAERMSWAARRQTTRVEDRAYSLLGIFDVNMPLLYGEAEKAFERLQIEVMRQSSDDSILAWSLTHELQSLKSLDDPNISNASTIPALASSPGDFVGWVDTQTEGFYERTSSIMEMTNRGLRVALPVVTDGFYSYGVLNCMMDSTFDRILAVRLVHTGVAGEYASKGLVSLSWQIVEKCRKLTTVHIDRRCRSQLQQRRILWHKQFAGGMFRFGMVRIQHPESCPEHLVGVFPKRAYQKEWNSLISWQPGGNFSSWERTLLHFKQDPTDEKPDGGSHKDGFVVVLDPRSPLSTFFSLEMEPPPLVCYTLPMPEGETLERLMSVEKYTSSEPLLPDKHRDLSKFRNRFSLKAGVPRAKIERVNFLGQEQFLVKIFYTKPLAEYVRSITNLRSLLGSRWRGSFRRRPLFFGIDLLLGLIPIVAWWLNRKRRPIRSSWNETATCGGLAFSLCLLRHKAEVALRTLGTGHAYPAAVRKKMRQEDAGFYYMVVYLPFAIWFPVSMYTLFPHSRKEVKVNPLVSVFCSVAIIATAMRGQKFL